MKKLIHFIVFCFALAGCQGDLTEKLDDLNGTWHLTEMTYTDAQGNSDTVVNSQTVMLLSDDLATGTSKSDGTRRGMQTIGQQEFGFQYSVDFSQDNFDILLSQTDKENLPLDAIGRVQVYQFRQLGESHIEFTVNEEIDYAQAQFESLTNVRYVFRKR